VVNEMTPLYLRKHPTLKAYAERNHFMVWEY